MSDKKASSKKGEKTIQVAEPASFAFGKENYIIMAIGVAIIALGFYLMSGTEDIFNTTKLTYAPIVVVLGFIVEAFAVMYKSKD
ncbi:MAG: DUF3098 domain-containing protein [Bacteroidia bacterium]|jgi:hypothetical protein